jgi:hypothetical protein
VLDRERIQHALDQVASSRVSVADDVRLGRFDYPSDAVAVQAALSVLEKVGQILERKRGRRSSRDLAAAADDLRDQIIMEIDRDRPSATTLDEFAAAVEEALEACPWWRPFMTVDRGLQAESTAPPEQMPASPVDDRPPLTRRAAAERLGVSVATLDRMVTRGEIQVIPIGPKIKRVPVAEVERVRRLPKYRSRTR